jgi:hypothetical protein
VTAKRDSKRKPKKAERPKVKKEKLKDLDTEKQGEGVKGGGRRCTEVLSGCGGAY